MELIDREELLRIIDRQIKYVKDDVAMDIPYNIRLNEYLAFKHIILNCEPINAEPTKHGRWFRYPDCGVTVCSECGWTIEECWGSKFCPDCGAKMDLRDDLRDING